jgi:hypothetical protein
MIGWTMRMRRSVGIVIGRHVILLSVMRCGSATSWCECGVIAISSRYSIPRSQLVCHLPMLI